MFKALQQKASLVSMVISVGKAFLEVSMPVSVGGQGKQIGEHARTQACKEHIHICSSKSCIWGKVGIHPKRAIILKDL